MRERAVPLWGPVHRPSERLPVWVSARLPGWPVWGSHQAVSPLQPLQRARHLHGATNGWAAGRRRVNQYKWCAQKYYLFIIRCNLCLLCVYSEHPLCITLFVLLLIMFNKIYHFVRKRPTFNSTQCFRYKPLLQCIIYKLHLYQFCNLCNLCVYNLC